MNMTNPLEELNIGHAIKGRPVTKLKDILQSLTKEQLNFLAGNNEIPGRSRLKKQELAEALGQRLADESELRNALLITRAEAWKFAQKLLSAPFLEDNAAYPGLYLFLKDKGLLYSFYDQDKLCFLIPEEIQEAYRRIHQSSFRKARDRYDLVFRYIQAAVNLYGVCPWDKVIEIFNSQNEEQLTDSEFLRISNAFASTQQNWYLYRDELLSDYFGPDNEDERVDLLMAVEHKPYYIPNKDKFLAFAEMDYFEMTPQLQQLHSYVVNNMCKDSRLVESLIDDVQLACSMEEPIDVIMDEFERRNIRIKNKEQLQAIIPLIVNVKNHTRLWTNRGHTPIELRERFGSTSNAGKVIDLNQQPTSVKVGRNEACPCGSGKKYKKCCGS